MRPAPDIRAWYNRFNAPVTEIDCGRMCAPDNPSGKPFCCDIFHAVPSVYIEEWAFLEPRTDLWQPYEEIRSDDPADEPAVTAPEGMVLLACLGPDQCRREFRAVSCRQFPFFPYITSDFRFIGLAYEWTFEDRCWVIRNLDQVTDAYRREFVAFYDRLFEEKMQEMESYSALSEEMREEFASLGRRIPLLHRNGGFYLVSPVSERARRQGTQPQ